MNLVTLDQIRQAAGNIEGVAIRTPLLDVGDGLWVKPENLQPIGAFKVRGATHAVAQLSEAARAAGVVTHSSGNHGQALAYAARRVGAPCVVVMPDVATPLKVEAVRALGAEVELVKPADRLSRTQELQRERGMALIPPFDHVDVIAGQGTIGLEILADRPDVAAVLVPVGGGGLAAGVATAVKALNPEVRVIGVEPELAADAAESLREHHLVTWPVEQTYRTSADGLRTNLSELTFAHLSARLDTVLTVSEAEIRSTMGTLVRRARIVAEPSGAVAPAAWLHRRDEVLAIAGRGPIVAVVSGGNVEPAALAEAVAGE
jgi:threonine dehydratase